MLLSRVLAGQANPFRTSDFTGSVISKFNLRMLVMQAQKFVVDSSFTTLFTDIEKEKLSIAKLNKLAEKKQAHYSEFARLPYPVMTIESNSEIIVIQQSKDRDILVYVIDAIPNKAADLLKIGGFNSDFDFSDSGESFSIEPSCECGKTKGTTFIGSTCPHCETEVVGNTLIEAANKSLLKSNQLFQSMIRGADVGVVADAMKADPTGRGKINPLTDAEYTARKAQLLSMPGSNGFDFSGAVIVLKHNAETKSYKPFIQPPRDISDEQLMSSPRYNTLVFESVILGYNILEFLMRLNASNASTKTYQPTDKELEPVPRNMRPSYVYHILDLHFSKEEMELGNIADVAMYTHRRQSIKKREHLVRGHFKRVKGKLLWWNSFVRSRNSENGVVEKDYRLK